MMLTPIYLPTIQSEECAEVDHILLFEPFL